MRSFVEHHWGDLIGLLLLYTGVLLVTSAALLAVASQPVTHLGESLVLAGMGLLKLRGKNGGDSQPAGAPAEPKP